MWGAICVLVSDPSYCNCRHIVANGTTRSLGESPTYMGINKVESGMVISDIANSVGNRMWMM